MERFLSRSEFFEFEVVGIEQSLEGVTEQKIENLVSDLRNSGQSEDR